MPIKIVSFFAWIFSYIINRLVFIKIVNWHSVLRVKKKKIPVIYAFWHGRHFYEIFTRRNEGIVVMTSRSKDGEILTQVLKRYGFNAVRGSSSRGGKEAAFSMIKALKRGYDCAIAVDGPTGPEEVVKPGIFHIARAAKVAIVPMATAFRNHITVKSWDKYIIPLPFTKGVVTYGEPFFVNEKTDEEEGLALITEKISETTALADKLAGSKNRHHLL